MDAPTGATARRLPSPLDPRGWRYPGGRRDLRLDLLRGMAVVAMVVDHIGGERSWFYALTGGNRFFVGAAEAFVFISGLVFGIVYARVILKEGLAAGLLKALKRARTLYALTVVLTVVYAALSAGLGLPWAPPAGGARSPDFLLGVLTLRQTFYLTDILLLYTFLVVGAALVLYLLTEGRTAAVLGGSWLLWALYQYRPDLAHLPWPIAQNDLFNLAAWQALFVTGIVVGYHWPALARRCARLPLGLVLLASGLTFAVAVALYLTHDRLLVDRWPGVTPDWVRAQFFAKESLRAGRLLVFAALAPFALTLVTLAWGPIRAGLGWLLLPLGQHALLAYGLHLFVVAGVVKAALLAAGTTVFPAGVNTALQAAGLALVWCAIILRARLAGRMAPARRALADLTARLAARAPRAGGAYPSPGRPR